MKAVHQQTLLPVIQRLQKQRLILQIHHLRHLPVVVVEVAEVVVLAVVMAVIRFTLNIHPHPSWQVEYNK